jgi:hypothetical protein
MWNTRSSKVLIKKITKEYGSEIIEEGSKSVMGMADHIDEIVARVMKVDKDFVTLAREWRTVIERAAITEGIDKVQAVLAQEVRSEVVDIVNTKDDLMEIRETTEVNYVMPKEEFQVLPNVEIEMYIEETEKKKTNNDKLEEKIEERIEERKSESRSLEESIWAPRKERCENIKEIKAKVSAANVLGESAEHRAKSLKWVLRENSHVKGIYEEFSKGNQWCILTFDCEKGFKEAQQSLASRKEDYERLKLIREETTEREKINKKAENRSQIKRSLGKDSKEKTGIQEEDLKIIKVQELNIDPRHQGSSSQKIEIKRAKEVQVKVGKRAEARAELEEIHRQRGRNLSSNKANWEYNNNEEICDKKESRNSKQDINNDVITVWDLPIWTKRSQVFEAVRFIGRVEHIELIRSPNGKTKAEINFSAGSYDRIKRDEIWCLPFMDQLLVRVSKGVNSYNTLQLRNRHSIRLLDLPENANEVLLWRQVKKTGAKALHIFKNANGNSMSSATVYFEKEEDIMNSLKFSMFYYNNKLRWAKKESIRSESMDIEKLENKEPRQGKSAKQVGKKKEAIQKQEVRSEEVMENRSTTIEMEISVNEEEENNTEETGTCSKRNKQREVSYNTNSKKGSIQVLRNREENIVSSTRKRDIKEMLEGLLALVENENYSFGSKDEHLNRETPMRS